jgi:Alba
MKTPEGQQRNRENKKLMREERKASKSSKRAQHQAGISATLPRLPDNSSEDVEKRPLTLTEGIVDSIHPEFTNEKMTSKDTSTSSTDALQVGTELERTHDVTSMSIISSSHIQQKVTRALAILSLCPPIPPAKPKVVMLHSKAPVASKMISIAEIVKREIVKNGGKWYQYNKLGQIVEKKRDRYGGTKKQKSSGEDGSMAEDGDEYAGHDSEEEFETMKTPFERAIEGKPKVRAVPVMTLYLSLVRIDSLRKDHT